MRTMRKDEERVGYGRPTMLTCTVGQHTGSFPVTRTPQGWACPKHGGLA